MIRRTLALVAAAAVAAALAPASIAALVHVRVEGKTTTIFGAAEPRASAATPLAALEAASLAGEFYYHLQSGSFGNYVDQIGRYPAGGSSGWVFKVNGVSPPVGADKVTLNDGDTVLWYYATFGSSGGPPTLKLSHAQKNCYAVVSQDDTGNDTSAPGAVLHVDGRRVPTVKGLGCVGRHRGLVRATAAGAVRSNALS